MSVSDTTLVRGVLDGDQSAYAELYDRWAGLVRAVCVDESADFHAAADLAQEAFLRAYRLLGRLRDPEKFGPWTVSIARQVCREWRRSRMRESRSMQRWLAQRGSATDVAQPPDDALLDVREVLKPPGPTSDGRPLTEQERLALHAFYARGQDVECARRVLGVSRAGFYRVLSSACRRLRRKFLGQEVSP